MKIDGFSILLRKSAVLFKSETIIPADKKISPAILTYGRGNQRSMTGKVHQDSVQRL